MQQSQAGLWFLTSTEEPSYEDREENCLAGDTAGIGWAVGRSSPAKHSSGWSRARLVKATRRPYKPNLTL